MITRRENFSESGERFDQLLLAPSDPRRASRGLANQFRVEVGWIEGFFSGKCGGGWVGRKGIIYVMDNFGWG